MVLRRHSRRCNYPGPDCDCAAGLLCLKTAKSGGESSWSSSVSVQNELLRIGAAVICGASGRFCSFLFVM